MTDQSNEAAREAAETTRENAESNREGATTWKGRDVPDPSFTGPVNTREAVVPKREPGNPDWAEDDREDRETTRESIETVRETRTTDNPAVDQATRDLAATESPAVLRGEQGDWAKSNNPSPEEQKAEEARTQAIRAVSEGQAGPTDAEITTAADQTTYASDEQRRAAARRADRNK